MNIVDTYDIGQDFFRGVTKLINKARNVCYSYILLSNCCVTVTTIKSKIDNQKSKM